MYSLSTNFAHSEEQRLGGALSSTLVELPKLPRGYSFEFASNRSKVIISDGYAKREGLRRVSAYKLAINPFLRISKWRNAARRFILTL